MPNHAIHFRSGSTGTIVEYNLIVDCDRGIGFGLYTESGHSDGIIRNNMVHTSRDVGIGIDNSTNTQVYHNTVFTPNYQNSIEYRGNTSGSMIKNNLTNKAIQSRNGGTATLSNNLTTADSSYFISTDITNLNSRLSSAISIVVNKGVVVSGVSDDFDCQNRDANPDIGADEYQ